MRLGAGREETEIADEERMLARLGDALGAERLESELAAGAAMSLQEAIDLALGRSTSG